MIHSTIQKVPSGPIIGILSCLALIGPQWVLAQSTIHPAKPIQKSPAIVVVHGTFDASGDWWRETEQKVSFASELKRGFQSVNQVRCEILPFLWKTSTQHASRLTASRQLADRLKEWAKIYHPIHLVAHSHGGNVVLKAIDLADVRVANVVCLATPHVTLSTKKDDRRYRIPVYATETTVRCSERIINLWAWNDPVPETYASFRKGISEAEAIESTVQWRERLNHPGLVNDGSAFQEILEEWTGREFSSNLDVSPSLKAARQNISIASEKKGIDSHRAIHSSRMGAILGWALARNFDSTAEYFLQRTVISADSDDGSPISPSDSKTWYKNHQDHIEMSGWLLYSVRTIPTETLLQQCWDIDGSDPDVSFVFESAENSNVHLKGAAKTDVAKAYWFPRTHFRTHSRFLFRVLDQDLAFHDEILSKSFDFETEPNSVFVANGLIIEMKWLKAHF